MVLSSTISSGVYETLKEAGELRVDDFTTERVDFLREEINENYEEGVGISGSKFSKLVFGYQQELKRYEGIAFHIFGLIATKDPNRKKGPLFLVYKDDAGKTLFPVSASKFHHFNSIGSIRNSVDNIWNNEKLKQDNIINCLSALLDNMSSLCSSLSNVIANLK